MRLHHWILILPALSMAGCNGGGSTRQESTNAAPPRQDATQSASQATTPQSKPPVLLADQPSYGSPDEAVAALYQASASKDLKAMAKVLGLPPDDMCSGDPDKDAQQAGFFAEGHDQFVKIVPETNSSARVFFGKDNYPLVSPLVKVSDRWFFDSAGGKQELLAREMNENELATIGVCRAYVQAQYEYYAEDRNGDDVLEYAQKLGSTSGQHDGLYWPTRGDEPESPLGLLIAEARSTGYLHGKASQLDVPKPYHGYLFRVLTRQGADAPGGQYDYIINGRMLAGFALLAYPAKWGHTGTNTFEVGANGNVYQKDIGEHTDEIAGSAVEFNPDSTWSEVRPE